MRRLALLTLAALLVAAPVAAQPLLNNTVTAHNATTTAAVGTSISTAQMSTVIVQIIPGSQDTYRLVFQGSLDNTNWSTLTCYPQGSSTRATSVTTTQTASQVDNQGVWKCNVAGLLRFRTNLSSITAKSGTGITVRLNAFQNPFSLGGVTY